MSTRFAAKRFFAILAKEFIQMRRDRITFAMMLAVPLLQLVLFGYAINSDPKGLPAALVAPHSDRYVNAVVSALENSGYYSFTRSNVSPGEAALVIERGAVSFVVTFPTDFARRVDRGETPQILIEADATDPAAASGAISTLNRIASESLAKVRRSATTEAKPPFEFVTHRQYNPEGVTQYNIVPGLLGVILQMTMVMMTSMALTRERERGTLENLLAMPASPFEIMIGKVTPYLAVGAVQVAVVLSAAKLLFGVPFVGSFSLLFVGILLFVLALVLLGYTISTLASSQLQAMQLTFFFFLPSLLLSGFMFPYRGMPGWAQTLGEIFPLTHFLRFVRGVMLKGADHLVVTPQLLVLTLFVFLYAGFALLRFRRTLD